MRKSIILLLSIFTVALALIPVFAGQDNNAKTYNKSFIYVYTPECRVCRDFNPIYNKISEKYKNICNFSKLDGNTKEGYNVLKQFKVNYVPFVVVLDNKKMEYYNIPAGCLLNYSCIDNVMADFTK